MTSGTYAQDRLAAENPVDQKIHAAFAAQLQRLIDLIREKIDNAAADKIAEIIPPTPATAEGMLSKIAARLQKIHHVEVLGKMVDEIRNNSWLPERKGYLQRLLEADDPVRSLEDTLAMGADDFQTHVMRPSAKQASLEKRAETYWGTTGQKRRYTTDITIEEIFSARSVV